MRRIKYIFSGITRPILIGVPILLVAIAVIITTSWVLYNRTVDILTKNLKDRLITISITQAANIDAKDLEMLQVEDDWKKPEWAHVINSLHKAKYSNKDVVFMYIFRKKKDDPTKMQYVADADSINPYANTDNNPTGATISASSCPKCIDVNRDGKIDTADTLQWPGQEYVDPPPETFQAYNGHLTNKDIYTDDYGSVLTGYSPITDENGKVVAILATDIKADDFFTITKQTLQPFLIFIAFLSVLISILTVIIIYSWKKYTKDLQEYNKRQEALIHFISHEVKGYMTKNEAAFAGILDGDYGAVTSETKTLAEGALADTRKGVLTVMDILSAANLKKGTVAYEMKPFNLGGVVASVAEDQKKFAEAKGLTLNMGVSEGGLTITGDEAQIRDHVIRNLIDNAIKYTPKGSIAVSLAKRNGKILFSVKDSGIGITEEDKKNLFTEGGRGKEAVRTNVSSTGYGLYIAKQIVDAHKGRIWAESEGQGKGSTFFVELPA